MWGGGAVAAQSVVINLEDLVEGATSPGSAASRLAAALAAGALTDARPLARQVLSQLEHDVPGTWLDLGTGQVDAEWSGGGLLTRTTTDGRLQVAQGANWKPDWKLSGDPDAIRQAASAPAYPNDLNPTGTPRGASSR